MHSELSPQHYFDDAIFRQEQTLLFQRLWIFAAFKTSIDTPNAFATRVIGGLPVLIQNCDGEIKAFENQCPHRLMPLQTEEFGQARLVCSYHGWVFDAHGKVKTIPNEKSLYGYPSEERERLALKKYAVAIIGNLVFINTSEDPIPLSSQFSDAIQSHIREMSDNFGDQSIHANIPANYNWKLNYENVLDSNHIPYIHPKSFSPLMEKVKTDESLSFPEISDRLIDQSFYGRMPLKIDSWPWHDKVNRYGEGDYYYNLFIFPNINFISVGGLTFLLQQFDPIAANKTEVRFTLTTAKATQKLNGLPAILRGHLRSEVDVLHEDIHYLEALQSNLHDASSRANHGKYEHRLQSFAKVYKRLLAGESPC